MEEDYSEETKPSYLIYLFVGIYFLIVAAMAFDNGTGSSQAAFSSCILYFLSKYIWNSWLNMIANNHLRTISACIIGLLIYALISFIILSMIFG